MQKLESTMKIFFLSFVTSYITFLFIESPFDTNWGPVQKFGGIIQSLYIAIPIALLIKLVSKYLDEQLFNSSIMFVITITLSSISYYYIFQHLRSEKVESTQKETLVKNYLNKYETNLPDKNTYSVDSTLVINKLKSLICFIEDKKNYELNDFTNFNSFFRFNMNNDNIEIALAILDSLKIEFSSYSSNLKEFYMIISYKYPKDDSIPYNGIMIIGKKYNDSIKLFSNTRNTYFNENREKVKMMFLSQQLLVYGKKIIDKNIWDTFFYKGIVNVNGIEYPRYAVYEIQNSSSVKKFQLNKYLTIQKKH